MSDAPAKVEPGDIGEGHLFTASGGPCCMIGHWAKWNGDNECDDHLQAFDDSVEDGEPFALALVRAIERVRDECTSPAGNVTFANDHDLTDEGRAEMWNTAVDVVRGQG